MDDSQHTLSKATGEWNRVLYLQPIELNTWVTTTTWAYWSS